MIAGVAAQLATGRTRQLTLVDALVVMAIIAAVSFGIAGPLCRWGRRRGWPTWLVGLTAFAINCVVTGFLTLVIVFMLSMPPH